jgi:hypothetical protein
MKREEIKAVITRKRDRPFLFEGIPKGIAEGNPIKAVPKGNGFNFLTRIELVLWSGKKLRPSSCILSRQL